MIDILVTLLLAAPPFTQQLGTGLARRTGDLSSEVAPGRPGLLDLRSVHPFGRVTGLCITTDGARAFLGTGAAVTVLDLVNTCTDPDFDPLEKPQVLARFPVDASVMALLPVGDSDLYVAGGSFGVLHVDVSALGTGTGTCDDEAATAFPVTTLDDQGDRWCFDLGRVSVGGVDQIVAVFGAYHGPDPDGPTTKTRSELRVYLLDGTLVQTHSLPDGKSYALAVDDQKDLVYVAMGTGGLVRVDLVHDTVSAGPVFDPLDPTPTVTPGPHRDIWFGKAPYNGHGFVRDVALAGDYLYAAVDDWGLVEVQVSGPGAPGWSTETVAANVQLSARAQAASPFFGYAQCDPVPSYAQRVDAITVGSSIYIAVGGSARPVYLDEGGPYYSYGRWSARGATGTSLQYKGGWASRFLFQRGRGSLARLFSLPRKITTPGNPDFHRGSEGGEFVLRESGGGLLRLFEQMYVPELVSTPGSFVVHDFDPGGTTALECAPDQPGALVPLLQYSTYGNSPDAGTPSLLDPDLILSPAEDGLARDIGHLTIADPDHPTDLVGMRDKFQGVGIMPINVQWIDPGEPDTQWFVTDRANSWLVHRITRDNPNASAIWQIPSPVTCDGSDGRNILNSFHDPVRDKLVLTRIGSRYGALVYDAAEIRELVKTVPPCFDEAGIANGVCDLPVQPEFVVDIHSELEGWDSPAFIGKHLCGVDLVGLYMDFTTLTLGVDFFTLEPDRRFAVFASGFHTNDVDAAPEDGVADDPNHGRLKIKVVDLDAETVACGPHLVNSPVGTAYGPASDRLCEATGNAIYLDVVKICDRPYAFVSDFGGALLMFDLSDPSAPLLADIWTAPVHPVDNRGDNSYDVLVLQEAGQWYAYMTLTRWGLVRLELNVDCTSSAPVSFPVSEGFASDQVEVRDTPGLAHWLKLRRVTVKAAHHALIPYTGLILGDKGGGMRFYGQFESDLGRTSATTR